jgi:hypothetical protein
MLISRFLYILVIFLLFVFQSECFPADLDMQIISGFDNYYKQDHWLPLRITLANASDELDGYVSAFIQNSVYGDQQVYSVPISFFRDARKTEYLYLRPEKLQQSQDIRLTDKNGKILLEKEASFTTIPSESTFVVIVDQGSDSHANITNAIKKGTDSSGKIYVASVSAESLPDRWKGYDSVDAIILGSFSVDSLSDNQKNALKDWVCCGGILIVSGGTDAQNFIGTFIETLLPIKINGTRVLQSMPSLTQRFSYDFSNAPIVVASSRLTANGQAIVTENDGMPVIAEREIGNGKIIFLCFDYADPALEGNSELWNMIIPEPKKQSTIKYDSVFRLLSARRHLSLPSYKIIGGFLMLYVLCLGTISFFFERKKGLMWVIMALITTISALGAVGFSHVSGERLPVISDISIVDVYQDMLRARIRSYISLFSSTKTELNANFTGTDAVFFENPGSENTETYRGNNFKLMQNTPRIEIFGMKTSSFFYSESYAKFSGSVSVIQSDEGKQISLISNIPYNLTDCYLFLNGCYAQIGALNTDAKTEVELSQTFTGNVFDSYSVEDDEKSRFINAIKPILLPDTTDKVLIGWMNSSALRNLTGMDVKGGYKPSGMALVIIHL